MRETEQFLLYDTDTGKTELVDNRPTNLKGRFFRKVHNTNEKEAKGIYEKEPFIDEEFESAKINPDSILPNEEEKVVFRRLTHLYPKKHRPDFFPINNEAPKVGNPTDVPHFLIELGLFPVLHYKTLFVTQDWNEEGRYLLVYNSEGRYETDVVDDYIPVFEKTDQPIWGMSLKYPWLLILAKMWAKQCGGFDKVKDTQPMDFLRCFTNTNWKYYNLSKETEFVDKIFNAGWADVVLKTKESPEVYQSGLIPNEAAYEIASIQKIDGENDELTIVIKSTIRNKWSGSMSVLDHKVNSLGSNLKSLKGTFAPGVNLEKDIIMEKKDFYNLFAAAYVTSKRPHAVSDYALLEVEPNTKNAHYFEFMMEEDGFLDFSIAQPDKNLRKPESNSFIKVKEEKEGNSTGEKI